MSDRRIMRYRDFAYALSKEKYDVAVPIGDSDDVARLGTALTELAHTLQKKTEESRLLLSITEKVNSGLMLDEILEHIYESFREIIPYNRIGFSLIEEGGTSIRSRWARSDAPVMEIRTGYTTPLPGSSLQKLMKTREPRILNDLPEYLRQHPGSDSTRLITAEGMRSSLTCPLIAMDRVIGFIFFSSMQKDAYDKHHVLVFQQIAGKLSIIVEKGRLYQELFELHELRKSFLAMAAHDLRDPLVVAKDFLRLMLEGSTGPLTDEQKDALQKIHSSTESMSILVNDLLDLNTFETDPVSVQPASTNLGEILLLSASLYNVHAKAKGISIRFDLQEPLGMVTVDPERIKQVIGNLLSNAIKFSREGSTVTIHSRRKNGLVEIGVTDQGPGLSESERELLFRKFHPPDTPPAPAGHSIGLGLAISKRIVEAHGGTIAYSTSAGDGSTFSFTLPA